MEETRGLRLEGVRVARDGRALFQTLDMSVGEARLLTLMGPSGVGKSTLLNLIAGHLDTRHLEASGRVLIDGVDVAAVPPHKRRVGLLFQDDLLFPHLSVAGNLLFGFARKPHAAKAERLLTVEAALAEVGLAGFGARDPATLSGGERARVALMRVLLSGPAVLLLDEPFSKLDKGLRGQIRGLVFELARARGLPTLLVTHDGEDAAHAERAGGRLLELQAPTSA